MKLEEMSWMGKREFTQKARKSKACDISIKKSISGGKTKARDHFIGAKGNCGYRQ